MSFSDWLLALHLLADYALIAAIGRISQHCGAHR